MKQSVIAILISVIFSFSSTRPPVAAISGKIIPAEGAQKVWAISGADSVSTIPAGGKFSVNVKEGTWNLLVEAVKPYQNAVMTGIVIIDNQPADVGTITLKEQNQ